MGNTFTYGNYMYPQFTTPNFTGLWTNPLVNASNNTNYNSSVYNSFGNYMYPQFTTPNNFGMWMDPFANANTSDSLNNVTTTSIDEAETLNKSKSINFTAKEKEILERNEALKYKYKMINRRVINFNADNEPLSSEVYHGK